jgi:hypothetical protein
MWSGGNQWSAWVSYLSFFRHVAGLNLKEYAAFDHYEQATIHSGPRMMHPDFCMVSDRPKTLKVDAQSQPHCEDGPSHEWRDGWRLWFWHGVRVPQHVIEAPETITVAEIQGEKNAEVRRVMVERMGAGKYLREVNPKVLDVDSLKVVGASTRILLEDPSGEKWLVGTDASTKRVYTMAVPRGVRSCSEAHRAISGLDSEDRIIAQS